ncbi:MAG TPA: hypothetical protein VFF95_19570 [Candidatus Binatus sp.]|jgi:hypothetical protein|nr:hypothetical protein [Candidatus Binatus sp.]
MATPSLELDQATVVLARDTLDAAKKALNETLQLQNALKGSEHETAVAQVAQLADITASIAQNAFTKANEATAQKPQVTLSFTSPLVGSGIGADAKPKSNPKFGKMWAFLSDVNTYQILIVSTACCLAAWGFVNDWMVANNHVVSTRYASPSLCLAVIAVVMIDVFLMCLFAAVVHRCEKDDEQWWPKIPGRGAAVIVLLTTFWALVFAFARINKDSGVISEDGSQLYHTFLTVATLDHDHYAFTKQWSHVILGTELLTVMLLIAVFFPLLIGRLVMFKGEIASPRDTRISIKAHRPIAWAIHGSDELQTAEGDTLSLIVDEIASVKVQDRS